MMILWSYLFTPTRRRLLSHSSGFCYTNFDPTLFRWGTANDKNLDKFHGTFVRYVRKSITTSYP